MKKVLKIAAICIFSIIAAIVIAFAVLYFAKPDLVKAVYKGLTASGDDIQADIEKNDKELVDKINDFGFSLTLEELQKLNNGNLTEQEMKDLLLKGRDGVLNENTDTQPETPDSENSENNSETQNPDTVIPSIKDEWKESTHQHTKPSGNLPSSNPSKAQKPPETTDTQKPQQNQGSQNGTGTSTEYDEKIAELVAKMYVLKSKYLGEIEGVVSSMKAEYAALPKDQQTASAKTNIASGYLGKISALEAQCDAQVNAVVTELRGVLEKSGGDMSLADAIMSAYASEKESTKAYYINKYS